MSKEKTVSIYDYKPEHFGDTILEDVIVRDIHTAVVCMRSIPSEIVWIWRYAQRAGDRYAGPWSGKSGCIEGVASPPTRADVMADIATVTRRMLAEGDLFADAYDVTSVSATDRVRGCFALIVDEEVV